MDTSVRDYNGEIISFAASFNLTADEYLKIVKACTSFESVVVLELMKSKNPRAGYRRRMQEKVKRWLDGFPTAKPLTELEVKQLAPRWPVQWKFPKSTQ